MEHNAWYPFNLPAIIEQVHDADNCPDDRMMPDNMLATSQPDFMTAADLDAVPFLYEIPVPESEAGYETMIEPIPLDYTTWSTSEEGDYNDSVGVLDAAEAGPLSSAEHGLIIPDERMSIYSCSAAAGQIYYSENAYYASMSCLSNPLPALLLIENEGRRIGFLSLIHSFLHWIPTNLSIFKNP